MPPGRVSSLLRRLRLGWGLGRPLLRSCDGTDLSRIYGPGLSGELGNPLAVAEEAWERFALTEQQLRDFHERGYVAGIPILTGEECDALAAEVQALLTPGHPASGLWYAFHPLVASGAWRISFAFHDLAWSPRLRVAAYQLLGGPVRFLHDQIFCKPPRDRGPSWFGFHQDFSYWSWTSPMAHLTCWIALDDATADNGCLQYVPGSHRWGLLQPVPDGIAPRLDAVEAVLSPEQRRALMAAEHVELRRGHASFHHPLTLHGSGSNMTRFPRRAAVVNTIRDGVLSNCGARPASLGSFPFIPQGRPLGRAGHKNDRMYPLLLGEEQPGVQTHVVATGPGAAVLARLPTLPAAMQASLQDVLP
mmetsp:Transcript_148223/g.412800  ORF Transcript_148223/g.412800 Transcript_148223/m.412800 type:complete len:361 (-) Transcript_148223:128-1210(-)